jgi:hypothetical protein
MSSDNFSDDVAMDIRTLSGTFGFFVRQGSPRITALAFAFFLIARIAAGRWRLADAFVGIAVACSWHIQERLLHEYISHMRARRFLNVTLMKRLSEHHHRHHRDPWRTQTLFINARAYRYTVPSVFGVLLAVTRDIRLTLTGTFAYFLTLLCYEWVHCLIHTSYVPRMGWYQRRWWNHRLHHFKNRRYWFGITSPMWDTVLGSKPDPSYIETRKDWRGPNPME